MRTVVRTLGPALFVAAATASATPWADEVVAYDPGAVPQSDWITGEPFTNAGAALGAAATHTGTGAYAGPANMFNAPYLVDQVVSIGSNGYLVLGFDAPVADRAGSDFVVYGNAGFVDPVWDDATLDIGAPASLYGADGGTVEVSPDGVNWRPLDGEANGLFPTQPWLDTDAAVPARFGKPMPRDLALSDFDGLSFEQALALYDGSAGGAAFDIASTGWSGVAYVRISYHGPFNAEVDAIRVVPEPAIFGLVLLGALGCLAQRRT